MRVLVDAVTLPARERFSAAVVVDAWRRITPAQFRATFAFGLAAFSYHVIVWSYGMLERPSLLQPLAATFIHDQLGAFLLLLAVVVADRVARTRSSDRAAYALAVFASAAISAPVGSAIALWIVEDGPTLTSLANSTVYSFCEWVILSGAAVFVYTDRRRARAARERMHRAEVARADAARRTLESRLQAMQARVEPGFLFNTLAQVRELYREDAAGGNRMLDDLIAYLRAAMPTMRDTTSTVGREAELVRAYLGIARLRHGERLAFSVEAPEAIAAARMPPMMLLPLVDHALAQPRTEADRRIRIRASVAHAAITIEIADSGHAFVPERPFAGADAIRDRLAALYGNAARLISRPDATGGTVAVLEIPDSPSEEAERPRYAGRLFHEST